MTSLGWSLPSTVPSTRHAVDVGITIPFQRHEKAYVQQLHEAGYTESGAYH